MEAAEIESAQPWRVHYGHDIEDDGAAGQGELANAVSNLWGAALGQYFTDCRAALRGTAVHADKGEALSDLTSAEMPLLRHLCHLCGADVDRVAAGMIAGLDAGLRFKSAAMDRPVPEQAESYRGLDKWREKHKRRGKPQAITLR
ncbi:MAG: hypothetical protein ACQEUM_02605 [Pseudomonadota bacterium]